MGKDNSNNFINGIQPTQPEPLSSFGSLLPVWKGEAEQPH